MAIAAARLLIWRLAGRYEFWITATGNVGYAAESGSELSYGKRSRVQHHARDNVANDPNVAKVAATVSASALALHLDCSRTYIGKLESRRRDPAAR